MLKKSLCLSYSVAALIRFILMKTEFSEIFSERVEISTPLNSWKLVKEAKFWIKNGLDINSSNMFHEPPLSYFLYGHLIKLIHNSPTMLIMLFIFLDLLTAHFLYLITKEFIIYYQKFMHLQLRKVDPLMVTVFYLFNPFIIINCISKTTSSFDNLYIMGCVFYALKGNVMKSCFLLSLASLKALYPLILIIPISLQLKKSTNMNLLTTLLIFSSQLVALLSLSSYISGNWNFMDNVYGFILNIPNVRPGIGIFWYFLAEMFDQFRDLFIYLIQINIWLLYTGPLTVHHKNEPMFLLTLFLMIIATFKTYPCFADIGLYLAFLPLWNHLFKFMQQNLIVICAMTLTLLLSPVIWFLWIYIKSANANFYFGLMIGFTTAEIFLLVDLIIAYSRRKFVVNNYKLIQEHDSKSKIRLILE